MSENTAEEIVEMDTMRVEIKESCQMYYYKHLRRRPKDVFDLFEERDFSEKNMNWVHPETPLTISTPKSGVQKMKDARNGTNTDTRQPVAISEVKRVKITRPGRKAEVAKPTAKAGANASKKPKATSRKLSGNKKAKKDLDPNSSGKDEE